MNHRHRKRFTQQSNANDKAAELLLLNKEKLLRLDKIVEYSSEKNRNFFAAYLGLLIYVQAIVFSTTDLNLLSATDRLKMPIIDLTVPLVGFYVVIPFFIIALHFNFLQNLESHHNKLMRWQEAHTDGKVLRIYIQPFLFDFAILEKEGQMARLVRWANSLLSYNFAPITLALLLIRYSDRQDWFVTVFHYLAFVFDVWLVWKLRLAIQDNQNPQVPFTVASIRGFIRDIPREGFHGGLGCLVFIVTLATVSIGGTSANFFVAYVQPLVQPITQVSSKLSDWKPEEASWLDNDFFKAYIQPFYNPGIQLAVRTIELFLPRIAIDPSEVIWKPDAKTMETEAKLSGSRDWVEYFKEDGKGFRPSTISLRLTRLPQQNLLKAQFNKMQLQGADLSGAELQGADLDEAQLQGAELSRAELTGAYLNDAQLQGADLTCTQIQDADLFKAQLQGADLSCPETEDSTTITTTQLQGANLQWAELQGAELSGAQLQGANMNVANMKGADLQYAQLQGANLIGAQLQGAKLCFAQLQGADLSLAELQGADLLGATLQGAILNMTRIDGIQNPDKNIVFSSPSFFKDKTKDMFDKSEINSYGWGALEAIANEISDDEVRANYLANIQQAKDHPSFNAEKVWTYHSATIAVDTLIMICDAGDNLDVASRLAAVQGIRINYEDMMNNDLVVGTERYTPDLVKNMDKTLCTHESCKNLRDGIKGLDCKTVKK